MPTGCPRALARSTLLLLVTVAACSSGGRSTGRHAPTPSSAAAGSTSTSATTAAPHEVRLAIADAGWALPAPRAREVVVAEGGDLVVAGGLDGAKSSTAGVTRIAVADGRASAAGPLTQRVHDGAGALLGGSVVVLGGGPSEGTDVVERLGPAGSSVIGHLPGPRSDLAAATRGGTAYVVGGYAGARPVGDVLATTDGVRFTRLATLPTPVRYPAVCVVDGRLLVFGGDVAAGETATIQAVDLRSGAVTVAGSLPQPVGHAVAVALGGRVWVAGGRTGGNPIDRVWSFDPASGAVADAGRLPGPVADAGAAVVGDAAYVVGGETPAVTAHVLRLSAA
jgi:hypothetical protein